MRATHTTRDRYLLEPTVPTNLGVTDTAEFAGCPRQSTGTPYTIPTVFACYTLPGPRHQREQGLNGSQHGLAVGLLSAHWTRGPGDGGLATRLLQSVRKKRGQVLNAIAAPSEVGEAWSQSITLGTVP